MISLVIAHYFGCDSVRLGKCGFFYVQHIKLTLRSGIRVEIDELRLSSSFFNAQFTKPIMLTIGDMRIEGEKRLNLSENLMAQKQSSQQMKNKNVNNATAGIDVERWLHWLQYAGAMIRTARIVFIDAVPRCLLHSTFETVQLDAFRDREGMQLELSCRLAQAKLFTRGRTTPLLELSLTIAFCADLTISNIRLRRISVSITNPFLSLSDGLLEYLHENPIVLGKNDPSTVVTEETSDEADADGSESDAQSRSRLFRASLLSNIKLDVNNLVFRYIAQMDSEMNTFVILFIAFWVHFDFLV
ncbi:unnamed protein product [Anisakis simplex]|uniref:Fmp27 domain-containing protein n=1 Tax=Anisakis simplex TaxID=6269 RepID=A0A0M3KD82_ANISI|nr:unnamed protein product [Anisakis simplex]